MGRGACRLVAAKLDRLKELIARRERWHEEKRSVRRMTARVLAAEQILSGETLRTCGLMVSNATVGQRFDSWCATLREQLTEASVSATERRCLEHFLHVTDNMRPQLIQCYDLASLPRTNNDMEGSLRAIKTRYRHLSGRKNWKGEMLRYGRRVAYYEAGVRMTGEPSALNAGVGRVPHERWRMARAEQRRCQEEQLKQYRVRQRRQQFLAGLEARWAETTQRTGLLP
jgi:hypothetical protein